MKLCVKAAFDTQRFFRALTSPTPDTVVRPSVMAKKSAKTKSKSPADDPVPEETPAKEAPADGYVVVARRYRPKTFTELVGQDHVGRALQNAIETSRVGHAYLFTGARGVGKTSTARIFAKALNNPGGASADFDDTTDIAQSIDAGEDVDVIEIDGASNRGIDEIRSLRANVGVRPSRARFKIYIIDEVHMLTGAAFNALLKTLEEPPEHVKFIFCTTDPEKIPITVLSRCQRFDFAPVEVQQIVGRLQDIVAGENATASPEALELIARRAAGSMRDSQSLLEQVMSFSDGHLDADTVHAMLGTADDTRLHAIAGVMADRDAAAALSMLDQAVDAGVDAGRLAEQLLGYFRDLLAVTVGCDASLQRHTSASMHDELKQLGQRWGLQTVLAVVGLIDQTLVRIRHSVYARVLLEATLVQICNLPDLQSIADLAAASSGASKGPARVPSNEKKKLAPPEPVAAEPPAAPESNADPPPTPPPAASASPLTTQSITDRWPEVLRHMPDDTAALTRKADQTMVRGNELTIQFPAGNSLTLRRLDTGAHRSAIVDAVEKVFGGRPNLQLAAAAPAPKATKDEAKPEAPKTSRRERMKQIETHPLVQACVEHLEAEVMKIDHPR